MGSMRFAPSVLGLGFAAFGCAGPLGSAPLVLTEVPNQPSGQSLITLGAERSGCRVTRNGDGPLLLACPEGELAVPTFAGPPTFAVQCKDERLRDLARCSAVVRKLLLASEGAGPSS
jgi:hypothetical protein